MFHNFFFSLANVFTITAAMLPAVDDLCFAADFRCAYNYLFCVC
jgi:hypothetical protein